MNNQNLTRGCWSLDEKMGQTYFHFECANTLAARDFKQPQAVIYETDNFTGIESESRNDNE